MFTMFAGRLGAITIMISLMGRDKGKKLVDYPGKKIQFWLADDELPLVKHPQTE